MPGAVAPHAVAHDAPDALSKDREHAEDQAQIRKDCVTHFSTSVVVSGYRAYAVPSLPNRFSFGLTVPDNSNRRTNRERNSHLVHKTLHDIVLCRIRPSRFRRLPADTAPDV